MLYHSMEIQEENNVEKKLRLKSDPTFKLELLDKQIAYWQNVIEKPKSLTIANKLAFTVEGMKGHAERMIKMINMEKADIIKKQWVKPKLTVVKMSDKNFKNKYKLNEQQ